MKFFHLFLFFCFSMSVSTAQRRSARPGDSTTDLDSTNSKPLRRGRARFVVPTEEIPQEDQAYTPPTRRVVSRRRPSEATPERRAPPASTNARTNYEVQELINEGPIDTYRKVSKARVITENKFEAQSAPPIPSALFQPAPLEETILSSPDRESESLPSLTADFESDSVFPTASLDIGGTPEGIKTENEVISSTRSIEASTTASSIRRTPENRRDATRVRSTGRSRNQRVEDSTTPASVNTRVRTRTRTTVRVAESLSSTTSTPTSRGSRISSRRRLENVETRTRGPPVFTSPEAQELPTRSRAGRRIGTTSHRIDESVPEKISIDIPSRRTTNSNRRSFEAPLPTISSRRSTASSTENTQKNSVSRGRSRSLNQPPVIDEQKLEVLPLFEVEAKTVKPRKKLPTTLASRRRAHNFAEDAVQMSATETHVEFVANEIKSTVATKAPLVSRKQSVVVETRTETSFRRKRPPTPKPIIKESVLREVSEVTSRRTVTRKTLPRTSFKKSKSEIPTVSSVPVSNRGNKKSEVKSSESKPKGKGGKVGLTSSEEDIDDSDNYPEPFKALIQAKKQGGKESRPEIRSTTEKIVSSSGVSSSSEAAQIQDIDNELTPTRKISTTPIPKSKRHRTPPSERVKLPTRKTKFTRSTTKSSADVPVKEHKFHAKFNSNKNEVEATSSPVKASRAFAPKPPRGLYSSRKNKEGSVQTTRSLPVPTQLTPNPSKFKTNRFSSRYRSDPSSRSTIRTSTNAPAYLPTIPTINPPTHLVRSGFGRDKDLGVEVITFDDPVNTIPSANLISDDLAASTVSSPHLTKPLVSGAQTKTEKPVSIIEQIINSITAISTTEEPNPSTKFSISLEPTKSSAILKLATKKMTKLDNTDNRTRKSVVAFTTENPTTIIERILTSLSAINSTNNDLKAQVGTDFNTISSPATTPMSRVANILPAHVSTSVNPLSVLDELSDEQTLQKRTIGKLLALLNSLTSPPPSDLVMVTPKTAGLVSSTTFSTIATSLPTQFTTIPQTTLLYTSPNPRPITPSLSARFGSEETPNTTPNTITITSTPQPSSTISTTMQTTTQATTPDGTTISSPVTTIIAEEGSTFSKPTTIDLTNDIDAVTLNADPTITTKDTQSTESSVPTTTDTFSTATVPSTETTFNTETETSVFTLPSTIPALINFEVSPGSVSVFNANDLSNAITPDDLAITISARTNFGETATTRFSTTSSTANSDSGESSTVPMSTIMVSDENPTTMSNPATTIESTTLENSTVIPLPLSTTITVSSTTSAASTTDPPSTPATTLPSSTSASTLPSSSDASSVTSTTETTNVQTESDISLNTIDSTLSVSNQTVTDKISSNSTTLSNRSGRLLDVIQDSVQNSIDSTARDKDYFIFAVLNNNTILRKRPDRYPNKETPYLLIALYPNNTVVKRFPNGTVVPMEPVLRVSGFDTRENPPPLPEITSNQVTPDQGDQPDNTKLRTVDQNTISPIEVNALSISSTGRSNLVTTPIDGISGSVRDPSLGRALSSTAAPSSTAASTPGTTPLPTTIPSIATEIPSTSTVNSVSSTNVASTTTAQSSTTDSTVTLPTLSEILNGRTVQAFNSIINISDLTEKTLDVDPNNDVVTTTTTSVLPTILSNRVLDSFTATTTNSPTTLTTEAPTTIITTTKATPTTISPTRATTSVPLSIPPVTTFKTTTSFPTTTFFPQFLTTLFSTLQPRRFTTPPPTTPPMMVPTEPPTTTPKVEVRESFGNDLASASTTTRPVSTAEPLLTATFAATTTTTARPTTTATTTTTVGTTNQPAFTSLQPNAIPSSAKTPKQLSEQQIKDLQTITQLEKEQAAILKQLSFLANLNLGNAKPTTTTDRNSLANRIIALAIDRQKGKEASTTEGYRDPKKISPLFENNPSIDELVKQIQSQTSTTYGKSDEAIIAALLKQQGIGPSAPENLEDIYSLTTTTTKRPRTTTRAPGPIMQSLNWLLNALAPPTTRRPKTKPKPKKQPIKATNSDQDEVLSHQPTRNTPVVTAAPNAIDNLSQDEVKSLIKQLEELQKNPNENVDLSQIKSLQNLINTNGKASVQVEVTSHGSSGTSPITTITSDVKFTPSVQNRGRAIKATTPLPLSVSNNIADELSFEEVETTTSKPKISLPPIKFNPVPGVTEESGNRVRGQLLTAAVNVTRAISQFLGSALQGAASGFQTLVGSSSRMFGGIARGSAGISSPG